MKKFALLILFVSFFAIAGCGNKYGTCEVEGNLTFKGQPAPRVSIEFVPVSGIRSSLGMSDEKGHFQMRYTRKELGVEKGKHKVVLSIPPMEGGEKVAPELSTAVAKYTADKTTLEFDISKPNKELNIEIKP